MGQTRRPDRRLEKSGRRSDRRYDGLVAASLRRLQNSNLPEPSLFRVSRNLCRRDCSVMTYEMVRDPFVAWHLARYVQMHDVATLVLPIPYLVDDAPPTGVQEHCGRHCPGTLIHQWRIIAEINEERSSRGADHAQ